MRIHGLSLHEVAFVFYTVDGLSKDGQSKTPLRTSESVPVISGVTQRRRYG